MIKHGNVPFIECSSKGDKRFSAFYAEVNGKTIERQYQAAKVFNDGSTGLHWKAAKGRAAVNGEQVRALYTRLWEQYIEENPELLGVLKAAYGLCDTFGEPGHVCQATELWKIRNKK